MKKLLFVSLFLPLFGYAQLEIGANAGLSYLSGFQDKGLSGATGFNYDFTVSYKVCRYLKAGIGYELPRLSATQGGSSLYFGNPAKVPYLFADAIKRFGKSTIYAGATFGSYGYSRDYYQNGNEHFSYSYGGPVYGLQAGYSRDILKGLCANVEIGYRACALQVSEQYNGNPKVTLKDNISYIPVTVGIHYKIHFLHKKRT